MSGGQKDRFLGCLIGLAVGDAVGTTLEFRERGTFQPLTDMVGGGPFNLEPGQWTDDTSMALCLAESLLECGGFDAEDQMNRYLRWRDEGYMSSTGICSDIGNTISDALFKFETMGEPFAGSEDSHKAGNGCIMRLAPVPMYFFRQPENAIHYAAESSRTTHGTRQCLDACRLFAAMLVRALDGAPKDAILGDHEGLGLDSRNILAIAKGQYRDKSIDEIRGTGYVVESLEAALWCFLNTDNFRDAILKAANLGDDADTTAAVCGQLAGAYYGVGGIPASWLERLSHHDLIEDLALRLYANDSESASELSQ